MSCGLEDHVFVTVNSQDQTATQGDSESSNDRNTNPIMFDTQQWAAKWAWLLPHISGIWEIVYCWVYPIHDNSMVLWSQWMDKFCDGTHVYGCFHSASCFQLTGMPEKDFRDWWWWKLILGKFTKFTGGAMVSIMLNFTPHRWDRDPNWPILFSRGFPTPTSTACLLIVHWNVDTGL